MQTKIDPVTISAAETARVLNVSKPTVYQYMKMAGFPAVKLGGRTLISYEGLKRWIAEKVEEGATHGN